MDWAKLLWKIGGRLPRRVADAFANVAAPVTSLTHLPAVDAWADSVERATGRAPDRRMRRQLIEHWFRNNLWSLSLERWSDDDVRAVVDISDAEVEQLHSSLAGPGLVLALPHMGSWDFAGAWCARVGIHVVSVAERLPAGAYERFSAARAGMGMKIYPVDQPRLLQALGDDLRAGRMVCLLADRDLSQHGIRIPWPGTNETISVPAGPALLAQRTGADLRVATTYFDGGRLHMEVSQPVHGDTLAELMTAVVGHFADAVRRHPESWLMLRKAFR